MTPLADGSTPAALAHYMPGRIRIKIHKDYCNPEFINQINGLLESIPGIQSIEVRQSTLSMVIRYDPSILDPSSLLEIGAAANLINTDGYIAADGGQMMQSVPRREVTIQPIRERSQWYTITPLVFVGWALWGIMIRKNRPAAPWYALLWYAYQVYERGAHQSRQISVEDRDNLELAERTVDAVAAIESVE